MKPIFWGALLYEYVPVNDIRKEYSNMLFLSIPFNLVSEFLDATAILIYRINLLMKSILANDYCRR